VTSTATPGLSGTYSVSPAAQANLATAAAAVAASQGFPDGASALAWPDAGGAPHQFTTPAEFLAFAAALEGYAYALQAHAAGQPIAVPATPLVIP
jgi:hypothetical protein